MSSLRLAPVGLEPLVVQLDRDAGAVLRGLPDVVEHVRDAGTLSGLRASVEVDSLSSLPSMVATRPLVRRRERAVDRDYGWRLLAGSASRSLTRWYSFRQALS
jgi:hypothetical protein